MPLCTCDPGGGQGAGPSGTVNLVNGEFRLPIQAAVLPAQRGFATLFNLTYRSMSPNATSRFNMLGSNWEYGYDAYLENTTTGILRHDGTGRVEPYTWDAPTHTYTSPLGHYDRLQQLNPTTFLLHDRYGYNETYTQETTLWPYTQYSAAALGAYAGSNTVYRLTLRRDANNNTERIWPSHLDPRDQKLIGAVLDSHNRLTYYTHDGVYEYQGLNLNDTSFRIANYTMQFNWTTAYWNIYDSSHHRLATDPWQEQHVAAPVGHIAWPTYDPNPWDTQYVWYYENMTWHRNWDTVTQTW
ncbi:MAG: hypothetical protein LC620_09060, partial [Halobacteriales archaeon]|nr:hypothetical protein [Halobacteriales archaeon]